uniref:Reverse transcriptase domain-containing protein n=1 Tax=Steinernema glaseri TaxID=37863 RepID=A0A1I7Y673_9BILA
MLFTKLFRPLLAKWRGAGISCALYLDDGLIFAPSVETCREFVSTVRSDLAQAGVIIAEDKSQWDPVSRLTWLGYEIDLGRFSIAIAEQRIQRFETRLSAFVGTSAVSKRDRMRIAGLIASVSYVFGPVSSLKARSFHAVLHDMELHPTNARRTLSDVELADARWWCANLRRRNHRSFEVARSARRLATDASAVALGASLWLPDGGITRSARNLNAAERAESSTFRELLAVQFAVKVFA